MRLRIPTAVSLTVMAALVAGCGAGGTGPSPPSAGRAVFARSCSGCHSLSGADDPGRQGGDLLDFSATRAQMMQLAGEMPVRRSLSPSQLRAVVSFVVGAEGAARTAAR